MSTSKRNPSLPVPTPNRWSLDGAGIIWEPGKGPRVGHEDHLEMSGRQVSVIVRFALARNRWLNLERRVYWPNLRGRANDERGYLTRSFGDAFEPAVLIDGVEERVAKTRVRSVRFDGVLTFEHEPFAGLQLVRQLFPSVDKPAVVERWTFRNLTRKPLPFTLGAVNWRQTSSGVGGDYELEVNHRRRRVRLEPGREFVTSIVFAAARRGRMETIKPGRSLADRRQRVAALSGSLRLETPDPVLNRCFAFACLRTGESLFDTKMGLVHSPGGGGFYAGIWANDQIEYAAPLFPFIGQGDLITAALNAFRVFAGAMKPGYRPIPSSFEVEGDVRWTHCGDRGDAAMYLYGGSRFLLALGDRQTARKLWPALAWCAEFCRRKTNRMGVIASDTDELEGRFPAGKANLSTSSIAYGGYQAGAAVARELGKFAEADEWESRAERLGVAIERHFGAVVEGFPTYRYFAGCDVLRAWICAPLTVGLLRRATGTIRALFSPRLWTADGVATEAGKRMFWDRATVYALRGVLAAGETAKAMKFLAEFSRRRLLGDHVPYMIEEENEQNHLAAESALYARVFTEGLFGMVPTGFTSLTCRPRLPRGWPSMALRGIAAFGRTFDLIIKRLPGRMLDVEVCPTRGRAITLRIRDGATAVLEFQPN